MNRRPAGRICTVVMVYPHPDLTGVAVVGCDHVQARALQYERVVQPHPPEAGRVSHTLPGDFDRVFGVGREDAIADLAHTR